MESNVPSKSLFEQIVDHALNSLQDTKEFDEELLQKIRILSQEDELAKPAALVRTIKGGKEEKQ